VQDDRPKEKAVPSNPAEEYLRNSLREIRLTLNLLHTSIGAGNYLLGPRKILAGRVMRALNN
jgi:hypothetical protein